MTPQLLTSDDVAKLLVITTRQAGRMMNAGTLPTVRVAKSELRVPADALKRWIESHTQKAIDGTEASDDE